MSSRGAGRPCVFCGIHPNNRAGVAVFAYTLIRSISVQETERRTKTRSFGSLSICERCRVERHRGATMVTAGFRSEALT